MTTRANGLRLLVPTMICAAAVLAAGSSAAQRSDAVQLPSEIAAASVNAAPLILSDFDRSAVRQRGSANPAGKADFASGPLTGSLVGPERITLPRAGGTTSITLAVQGLSLTVRPISLPSGISVSLSGNQLTVVSTANRGVLERAGSFAITAQSPNNPLSGRLRGVLTVGVSQLPCTAATCPSTGVAPPVNLVMAPSTPVAGIDWSAVAASMRERTDADMVLVVIDGDDSPGRTSGASIKELAQLCAANGRKCILELGSQRDAASHPSAAAYFLSPDVHAALYGAESQFVLSLRGEAQLEGASSVITQLRAAGLGHTLLVNPAANAARILQGDPNRNTLLARHASNAAPSPAAAARLPAIVVPQVVIATAPLVPVDFEINGQAFVVDRSLVAFDAAGGSTSLRFLQSGGLRWAVRKVPNSFVQGGSTFPQTGRVTLSVGASNITRSERVEFSAKTANGAVALFIAVAVIQDADGSVF